MPQTNHDENAVAALSSCRREAYGSAQVSVAFQKKPLSNMQRVGATSATTKLARQTVLQRRARSRRNGNIRIKLSAVFIVAILVVLSWAQFGPEKTTRRSLPRSDWKRHLLSLTHDDEVASWLRSGVVSKQIGNDPIDTDLTNFTVVLEHVQLGPAHATDSPWMFANNDEPFNEALNTSESYYANNKFTWNPDGIGDSTCDSGGSGKLSRGYIEPYNDFLNLSWTVKYAETSASLDGLELSEFFHYNTEDVGRKWSVQGEGGDTRRYKNGVFELKEQGVSRLKISEIQWFQNTSYPFPAGRSRPNVFSVAAYFVGKIDYTETEREVLSKLDPSTLGYVLGIVTGGLFGPVSCYSSNTYKIAIRGFPSEIRKLIVQDGIVFDPSQLFRGNSTEAEETIPPVVELAKFMGSAASTVVGTITATAISMSVASGVMSAMGVSVGAPSGTGATTMLSAAAFAAKLGQVPGNRTDTMKGFASGLDPFLVRFSDPFGSETGTESTTRFLTLGGFLSRQDTDDQAPNPDATISEDLFKGCAFYCSVIVISFGLMHVLIWFATRRKPVPKQIQSHAWMIYLFSVVMSYIYTGSVLNSMQYFRSNVPAGTGKLGVYFVAAAQLILIGIGFTVFFCTIMFLAIKRLQRNEVRWVPRELVADPDLRRSTILSGEYEADRHIVFHELFQCYYSALSGPRVWLAAFELSIVFIDAALTALVWNDVVCLSLLVTIYLITLALFVFLTPFADKVQGILVITLVILETSCFVLELISAVSDDTTAERAEAVAVVAGFVAIGVAVAIALYCDVIPTLSVLVAKVRRKWAGEKDDDGSAHSSFSRTLSNANSAWSGLLSVDDDNMSLRSGIGSSSSSSGSSGGRSRGRGSGTMDLLMTEEGRGDVNRDSEALVEFNSTREAEIAQALDDALRQRRAGSRSRDDDKHDAAF